ncbi:MurR/RpiR family transcriptional regulator [Planomonospora sp. ID67723]|uniref:MurR/RpiR family transcriptional regulator n=1 Tax=Planomonospora sp. ID67723 TaxID=2738134 RepID=UPI0018C42AE0|nr:MurR/RpiR family transcriptional regulator [Planomonospora sp. ID67723]MBG0832004.1 MurR/RpiR family transcriptional regulator [Planomonospora sp. ID67723]
MIPEASSGSVGDPHPVGGVAAVVAAAAPGLRPSDARVMHLVIEDPGFVRDATVGAVAERAGVSPSTVVRACHAAGFGGFQGLKLALVRESARSADSVPHTLSAGTGLEEACATVLASHADSIRSVRATLDPAHLGQAVRLLAAAPHILVVGVGTSAAPATDAAYRFATIGCHAEAPADGRTRQLRASLLGEDDAVLAISHTGRSAETLAAVDAARTRGAKIVAITSFSSSPLAVRADALLVAGGPDLGFQMAASSSRLAHLAVVDVLHAVVGLSDPARSHVAMRVTADITEANSIRA